MNKLLFSFLIFSGLFTNVYSQISGKVLGENGRPLKDALIKIVAFKNDKAVKVMSSDTAGIFSAKNIAAGSYYLKISFVGYTDMNSGLFEITGTTTRLDLQTFKMTAPGKALNEVTIAAKTKALSQANGNLIVNLQNSPAAGGISALEEMERLPGVLVNRQNGSFSLKGKEGAVIMINGTRTYMPNDALLQLLSSTTASKISKIELISNPSSSMDAEGNSGIINIVLKKNRQRGINGSLEAQAGVGKGSISNFNGDLSVTGSKTTSYLSYSFARMTQDQTEFNSRQNNHNGGQFSINTLSLRDPLQRNHNLKYGLDYQLNDSSSIGAAITYYDNKWSMDAINNTLINPVSVYNNLSTSNQEVNHWQHLGGNFNFQSKLKNNRSISINLDYLYYKDDNPSGYIISNFDSGGNVTSQTLNKVAKHTPINITVPQINYIAYSDNKLEIKTGAKASFSVFKNNVTVFNDINNTAGPFTQLVDDSHLNEQIIASYAEGNYKINETFTIKGGLRYEHTRFDLNMNGLSPNIYRNYGNLFPNALLSYKIDGNQAVSAFYNKRINRPTFNDIAPFVLFLDPYTVFAGNPAIQPSTINNLGVDYSLENIIFSAGYSYEKNSLAKFQISLDPLTNIQTIRPENLGTRDILNLGVIVPFKISAYLDFQNSINSSRQHLTTGSFQNNRSLDQWNFQYTGTSTITIKPKLLMEVSGFYNTKSLSGTSLIRPYGGLNWGIQKKWRASTVRLNVNDIFNSIRSIAIIDTRDYHIRNGFDFSQRTFKVSYAYNWGKIIQNRKTAEEEKKRVE